MDIAAKLDDIPKPVWIGLMAFGFIAYWPLGLGVLAYLIWSKRMGCGRHGRGRWHNDGMERARDRAQEWFGRGHRSSGNHAFDEYRAETLKRLEEEEREFREFLDRLRFAKDKAEFDQFLTERRRRESPEGPEAPPQG
jgi:hypothetical protein